VAADAIRFQRPSFPTTEHIDRYFDLAREERWFSNSGPCWRLLRDRLSDRVGCYCVPVASGTAGLMASLAAVIEPRRNPPGSDGAIIPSFTFPATAQATIWAGLQPRMMDIEPHHWHLDAQALERVLGRDATDVRVVVAVSSFGTPPPTECRERWEQTCRSAEVPLVVDSAAGFGAVADDGTPIGAQGDIEVVSFHATKPFAIGEGGAVFTRSRELRDRVELAINFGLDSTRSVVLANAINGKMSELQAATALAVLDEFDSVLERRRRAASFIGRLGGRGFTWQAGCDRSTWQFVPIAARDSRERGELESRFVQVAEVRRYYRPLHELAAFGAYPIVGGDMRNTIDVHDRVLCLPMANDLDHREQEQIGNVLRSVHGADLSDARA
jgi:dTDP-4-amino-4,6-dideoxygalactose transaminase